MRKFQSGLIWHQVCTLLLRKECIFSAIDHFSDLCEVTADLFDAKKSVLPEMNLMTGELYYRLHFDIVLLFGLTELKAQMAWMENVSNFFHSIVDDI
jgi:hypothetical protein